MLLLNFGLAIAGILALQVTAQLLCARIDRRKFPPPGRLVPIPGAKIHVQQAGSGSPAIVLESGIAASSLSWCLLQPTLAEIGKTYSYDRAGFGWSVSQTHDYSLDRIAEDLHNLLRALGVPAPYILVGHSFGGYIARAYAQRFAGELAGVVLLDPLTPEEWVAPTLVQRWMLRRAVWFSRIGGIMAGLGVLRFCLWLLQRGNPQMPRNVLAAFGAKAFDTVGRILRELNKLPPEVVRVIRARWSTPPFFWTMASYIESLPRCAGELHGCAIPAEVPVTVLSGAHQSQERLREHAAIAGHSLCGRHIIA
ncbi:MAG TPA: alpha/beta fold hydrolase, partial [Terriglobales bacterium]|nr:alpha/beta fold hydrolase [Terriglobales bacterium]